MKQVIEAQRTTEMRTPGAVPAAAVGPFEQLRERIEHVSGTIAAPTVSAAPRGFLPTLWRYGGNGGAPEHDTHESAPEREASPFAAPRGFLP